MKHKVNLDCGIVRSVVRTSMVWYGYQLFMLGSPSINGSIDYIPETLRSKIKPLSCTIKFILGDKSCTDYLPRMPTPKFEKIKELFRADNIVWLDVNDYLRMKDEIPHPHSASIPKAELIGHLISKAESKTYFSNVFARPDFISFTEEHFHKPLCLMDEGYVPDIYEMKLTQRQSMVDYMGSLLKTKETRNLFTTDGKMKTFDGGTD